MATQDLKGLSKGAAIFTRPAVLLILADLPGIMYFKCNELKQPY
jgi:hypothetical protein